MLKFLNQQQTKIDLLEDNISDLIEYVKNQSQDRECDHSKGYIQGLAAALRLIKSLKK